jgi:hypothetical protein
LLRHLGLAHHPRPFVGFRFDEHGELLGDFNATLDKSSPAIMETCFRPTQTAPTAFTPLAESDGTISHPYWSRMDRYIDYI